MPTHENAARAMGAIVPPEVACRCENDCTRDDRPEDLPPGKWCRYCGLRIDKTYDPCPSVGFGCGTGARPNTPPCDCCTPEQWKRASRA